MQALWNDSVSGGDLIMFAEFGGYLPLELAQGKEYFRVQEKDIRRYNCGRTAIREAVKAAKLKKVYLPYYICGTVEEEITRLGEETERYSIDAQLRPVFEKRIPAGVGILLVNYFGMMDRQINDIQASYQNVILDCTQAFFASPILRKGVSNIYSCRKFVGVPDGAYLIEKDCRASRMEPEFTWEQYSFLCKSYVLGTNAAYAENLENERCLAAKRTGMSVLTRKILENVSYDFIRKRRRENYQRLDQLIGAGNRLKLPLESGVPYVYPYLAAKGKGTALRKALLEKRIYTPTLWAECFSACQPDSIEYELSRDLICLPIDQRYEIEDVERMAKALNFDD